jgi:dipeptidyl-peptidase-4
VAAAPIPDMYNAGYSYPEHYMGLPQNNPEGYQNTSCIEKAGNLKGKLLIVAGMSDTNAFFSGPVQMAEAFTRAGKPYDLIILPEQTHLYEGKSAVYYLEQCGQYFIENL